MYVLFAVPPVEKLVNNFPNLLGGSSDFMRSGHPKGEPEANGRFSLAKSLKAFYAAKCSTENSSEVSNDVLLPRSHHPCFVLVGPAVGLV